MPVKFRVHFADPKQAFEAILSGRKIDVARSAREPDGYWVETQFEGRVLSLREQNYFHDSDWYAVVWDDETEAPRDVLYATTRGATDENSASVDATDAVRAKYEAWRRHQAQLRAEAVAARELRTVRRGKRVRVVGGRKVPLGTVGVVTWIGEGIRGRERVGLTDERGEVWWTDARNVEVVLVETSAS